VSKQQRFVEADRVGTVPPPLATLVEAARRAALRSYRVLDADDVAGLSRLAEQAAQGLGAAQAAVSFVDATRVWFGGAFGFVQADTARQGSFCDAVVRSAGPLLVTDALDDPRFRDHELVRAGVRCYAGAPLIDEGGYRLGTVAVFSPLPNAFGPATLADLVRLAQIVRDFLAESRAVLADRQGPVQGWLGVRTLGSRHVGGGGAGGLVVLSVAKDSPAAQAGLRPTDILQSIDRRVLHAPADVTDVLAGREYGAWLPIRFRRAGVWHEGEVQVRPRLRSRLRV